MIALSEITSTIVLLAVSTGIAFLIYASIFRQAGYSQWWALLSIIPYFFLVFPLFLAIANWPAARELRVMRVRAGAGNEDDAYEVLDVGKRLEKKGHFQEALDLYAIVARQFAGAVSGKDAEIAMQQAKAKL